MKALMCIFCLCMLCIVPSLVAAETQPYDVIVVRNDIPTEYVIALPYASLHEIPILLVSQDALSAEDERQLSGYYQDGARRALILGGMQNAVSQEVEERIRDIGYDVDRKWGLARESTAGIFAIDLWQTSPNAVLLNGSMAEAYLVSARTAMKLGCPVLFVDDVGLNENTARALEGLGCTKVYVVGPGIPDAVFTELDARGIATVRIGDDITPHDVEQPSRGGDVTVSPLSLLAGACIGALAVYAITGRRREPQAPGRIAEVSVPLFVLTEDERAVVRTIETAGGELRQDALPDLTGYSRPKVSRIVNDLEAKKILSREKKGKTYKVKVAKKFIIDDENAPPEKGAY